MAGFSLRRQEVADTAPFVEDSGRLLKTQLSQDGELRIATQWEDGQVVTSAIEVPRALRDALRARLRKAGIPFDAEAEGFVAKLAASFKGAEPGETVLGTFSGVSVQLPKLQGNDLVTVTYKRDDARFQRLCFKIALEAAALAIGSDAMLDPGYDAARLSVLHGTAPPAPVADVRRPELPGPDAKAARSHTVAVFNEGDVLKVSIAFFECYIVEVELGPSALGRPEVPQRPTTLVRTFPLDGD